MEHAKKMALVPQNMLQQPTPQPYLNELDEKIALILRDKTVPSDVKAKRYNHALRQYMAFKESDIPEPVSIQIEDKKPGILDDLVDNIPRQFANKARVLINHVRKNPDISWNARGELVHRDITIPHSNALDLIQRFVTPGSKLATPPKGWREFGNSLLLHNAPRSAIMNKALWERIEIPETDNEVFSDNESRFATPEQVVASSSNSTPYSSQPKMPYKRPQRQRKAPVRYNQNGTGWKKW